MLIEKEEWYFTKEEITYSPSKKDGVEIESFLRHLYCSYIHDLGAEFKFPDVTIAIALMFTHRFYMRQSHKTNHYQAIAASSMFLACKVAETPCCLHKFVTVSYILMDQWDTCAPKRIKQPDVYAKHKELILIGERLVLVTLGFDLNVDLPYKPLMEAMIPNKKIRSLAFKIVDDMLRTTLCLQYTPKMIAAGSVLLAAKDLNIELERKCIWKFGITEPDTILQEDIMYMSSVLKENVEERRSGRQTQVECSREKASINGVRQVKRTNVNHIREVSKKVKTEEVGKTRFVQGLKEELENEVINRASVSIKKWRVV